MQGHYCSRLGKRVLRPGGRELTQTLLRHADLTDAGVLELAPGLGRLISAERCKYGSTRLICPRVPMCRTATI